MEQLERQKLSKKKLTDLDKASSEAQYDYKNNEIKRQKYTDKANKLLRKGKTNKAQQYQSKAKEYENERNSAEKRAKAIDKNINNVINTAMKDGYDVTMTRIGRMPSTMKGKNFVAQLAGGLAFSVPYMIAKDRQFKKYGQTSQVSEGYLYDVKPGAGTVTEKRKDLKLR